MWGYVVAAVVGAVVAVPVACTLFYEWLLWMMWKDR